MYICRKLKEYRLNVLIPLCVLLWKYVTYRKHRYCYTIWEVFGGVSVFLILFLVNLIVVTPKSKPHRIHANDFVTRVLYTPYNNFTRSVMKEVEYYFTNNVSDPQMMWDITHIPVPMNTDLENVSNTHVLVNFKNDASFATNLEYSINVIDDEPKSGLDTVYNGFFRGIIPQDETASPYLATLQWVIDKSYIEHLSNEKINQPVAIMPQPQFISRELRTLHKFLIICTVIAPLPYYLIHSSRLIVERRTGLRELMKLTGICSDVLRFSHLVETTFVAFLYSIPVTLLLKMTSNPILPYSCGYIISFTLILHFVNSASLAAITTALSNDFNHADSLGLLVYMSTFILDFLWYSHKDYRFLVYFVSCILPHAPIYLFWDEVIHLEYIGQGTNLFNIRRRHSKDCMSVARVWGFFIIQLALITTISWYLDLVKPGRYGVSKKWNFMFKKTYWYTKKNRVNFHVTSEQTLRVKKDEKFFESGPRKAEVAIKVCNVTKVFSKHKSKTDMTALQSVSFDCYHGEVTMLLGPHGAGKTTLLSIVTGMYSATKGQVYINGKDVAHKIMELREDLGYCMQNNISFRFLTVKENIMFFHKLRKRSRECLTVDQLMKKLKLYDKADHFSYQLSTGMLRCLQVACTLAGGADVLVLDEPTSGMDVEVRHRLWDLIMVLRGKKTILMSTTFLEEANALGDRIVILSQGKLKCHGTPMFLKQAIGTSFNLSITLKDSVGMRHLVEFVEEILPKAKHRIHDIRRITFSLPSKEHDKFPELFQALEENREEFGITLMDVGLFMEEVFLEFIEEEDEEPYYEAVRTSCSYRHIVTERIKGRALAAQRFRLLFKRVFRDSWLKKYHYLVLRVLVPIIGLIMITLTTNYKLGYDKMFSHYKSSHERSLSALLYNVGPYRRRELMFDIRQNFPGVQTLYSPDVDAEFLNPSSEIMFEDIAGIKITDNDSKIYLPSNPTFTSRSVSMYSNIYLKANLPFLNNTIRTSYEHLQIGNKIVEPKSMFLCLKWSVLVVFLSVFPLVPMITLCIIEHEDGIRDSHMMAGCTPILHWGSKLLAHLLQYLAIIPAPVLILTLLFDFDKTFNQLKFLGSLFAILLAFGPAFLSHLYFLSFILHHNVAVCQVYVMSISFGIILPILMSVLEPIWNISIFVTVPFIILTIFARKSPLFALGMGLGRLTLRARLNAYCKLNRKLCPNLTSSDKHFSSDVCCGSTLREPFSYLDGYETGLYDFLNLVLLFFLYSVTVLLLENRLLQYIVEHILLARYKIPAKEFRDIEVLKHEKYVRKKMRERKFDDDVLIVENIHKQYIDVMRRKNMLNAVRGVSFSVKLGECIAILGPQGSGKTTILKMLAGSQVMTRGTAYLDGNSIRMNRSEYIHKISLTSATGGFDSFMTGHENLMFIARLQGYTEEMAQKLSIMALRFMGLQPNDVEVSNYSSGCVRRLSLCNTLVLAPRVAFLDEPMTDMDANTRPMVAKALQRLLLEPGAVVLTEASVDWHHMQSVYTRIALMSKGQLATLGPAKEVLEALAKGYTARIKLKVFTAYRRDRYRLFDEDEETSEIETEEDDPEIHTVRSLMYAQHVVDFKADFLNEFPTSRVCGEHLCMIYFFIQDDGRQLLYSEMFQKLQTLKEKFPEVVEDYSLNSTTVEDVFWRLQYETESMKEDMMRLIHTNAHNAPLISTENFAFKEKLNFKSNISTDNLRSASTERTQSNKPTTSSATRLKKPTEPTKSTGPTDLNEPSTSTGRTKSTEPTKLTKPTKPTDSSSETESESSESSVSNDPNRPNKPKGPNKPK